MIHTPTRKIWTVLAIALLAGTGFCEEADRQGEALDAGVVLGEEDLAERAEIARNMFRRITPGDEPFVQDVGTWPVAWEEFPSRWDGAATGREYGAWVVPVSVEQENGATVIRDADDMELWRGTTDFAKEESASVTLTGGLVAEEDWDGYEAVRNFVDNASRQDAEPFPSRGAVHTNGLRFTSVDVGTNGTVELSLAWEEDGDVDVFAYLIPGTPSNNVVTWTNDENQVVTTTNTVWTMAGPNLSGFDNDWEWRGTASVSNGVGVFTDAGAVTNPIIMGFYAAAEANDTDGDGLNDGFESFVHHTDPENTDSDGDGWTDGEETTAGTNPLDRLDAPRPARGVLIHAVKYSTDTSNQWVQLHCSGPREVDVGGFRLQAAGTNWETQVLLPEGTWMAPGHFLLVGGGGVSNADVTAELALAGTYSNAPTAGVRLMPPEGATNGPVDVVMYAQNTLFNANGLDTTGWLSESTNLWASSSRHLERWNLGDDTDRESDWRYAADGAVYNAAIVLDTDGDGLTDEEEYTLGYNPLDLDMDGDGLLDGFETAHGLDPTNGDTDGDGTPDGEETDPDTGQAYAHGQCAQGVTLEIDGPDGWTMGDDLGLGGEVAFTLTDVEGFAVWGTVWESGWGVEDYTVGVEGAAFSQVWKYPVGRRGRETAKVFAVPNGTNAMQVIVTDASSGSNVTNPADLGADIAASFKTMKLDIELGGVDESREESPGSFVPNRLVHTNAMRIPCLLLLNRLPVDLTPPLPGMLSLEWDPAVVQIYGGDCEEGGSPLPSVNIPLGDFKWTNLWAEGIFTTNTVLSWRWGNREFGQDQARVTVYEVRFQTYGDDVSELDKPHALNIHTRQNETNHYGDFQKCVSHVWTSSPCDLTQYLEGHENEDLRTFFRSALRWKIASGKNGGTWTMDCNYYLGSEPDEDKQTCRYVSVALPIGDEAMDHLVVTVVPESTLTNFQQWFTQQSVDTNWFSLLPAPYSNIIVTTNTALDPETCGCSYWENPDSLDSRYHPDGYWEMRSESVTGGHGHQTVYDANGVLIQSGISAGSADRVAPVFPYIQHRNSDVIPFVWAAQLDGNPVEGSVFYTELSEPIMHAGVYLNRYLICRPPMPNNKTPLQPGECPNED